MTDTLSDFLQTNNAKVLWTLFLLGSIALLRWLVLRTITRRFDDSEAIFRSRKTVSYVAAVVFIFGTLVIWIDQLGNLGTFLGLFAAGVTIALSDLIKNIAGWIYILVRRPFRAGDRIQIGTDAGDVIDIRLLRFSLLEIRNWVDADQSTGRILHVPNGLLFTEPMANFTEGFPYVWHEIGIVITFESDWERAEQIIQSILDEHSADPSDGAEQEIEKASTYYFLRYRHLTPTVYVRAVDHGVKLTARLLVTVRRRRTMDHIVWKAVLRAFAAEPNIELAYPTTRFFRGPE
jgi:small-conductance mechanosensitive channel